MRCKIIVIGFLAFMAYQGTVVGQILKPAKWSVEFSQRDVKVGDKLDVVFRGIIDSTWYVYSNDFDAGLGPILISFNFEENPSYKLEGKVRAINAHKKYDAIWEGDISYFEKTAELRQTVVVKALPLRVMGEFEFQTCSLETGMCVMGDDEFDVSID